MVTYFIFNAVFLEKLKRNALWSMGPPKRDHFFVKIIFIFVSLVGIPTPKCDIVYYM